ncbi:hypothetical protein K435DRAFT_295221 [Dendrothele bispora CBS 962.96]|uniref:Uncharacterized protein n=1 Tax=Dendrothele bispora (strain CBS 962.96) TaxID=1314807 RepID=A0A4V4HDZ6_DENBC|nr:hypothetical protein K435DRAFT_295221 [Dendrothele bispora CBS 962.96]
MLDCRWRGQRRRENDVSNVPRGLCPMRGLAPFSLSSASFILFISPSPLFLFLLLLVRIPFLGLRLQFWNIIFALNLTVPFCLRSSYSNNVEIYSSASPFYTLLKQNQIQESVEPGSHTKRNLFP